MSVFVVIACDGHRNGMQCRAHLPTQARDAHLARTQEGAPRGWRRYSNTQGVLDLCPSPGHDEEQPS